MKIRIYYSVWDCQDGDYSVEIHTSKESREEYIRSREAGEGEWEGFEERECSGGGSWVDIDPEEFEWS